MSFSEEVSSKHASDSVSCSAVLVIFKVLVKLWNWSMYVWCKVEQVGCGDLELEGKVMGLVKWFVK